MRYILALLLVALAMAQTITIGDVRFTLKNQQSVVTAQFAPGDSVKLCMAPSGVSTTEAIVRIVLYNPQGVATLPMEYDFTGSRRLISEQCISIKDNVSPQDQGTWTIRIDVLDTNRLPKGTNQLLFSVSTLPPPPCCIVDNRIFWAIVVAVIAAAVVVAGVFVARLLQGGPSFVLVGPTGVAVKFRGSRTVRRSDLVRVLPGHLLQYVSRSGHFKIVFRGNTAYLVPIKQVSVSGQAVTAPTPLRDGDRIEIGPAVLVFRYAG